MRNPFKRQKALTGTPEVVTALQSGQYSPWPSLGGAGQRRVLDVYNRAQSASYSWMYTNSPAVRTVIDVIVRNVGQLELRLYEEVSESERQPRPDHPAAVSLRYPNEFTSSDKLVRELFKDFLIHDNAYGLLTPAAGEQISIAHIPAYMVVVQGSSLFSADNYRVWPLGAWTSAGTWGGAGTWQDFTPDTILHWHGENPLDPRIGLSLLDTIRDVIAEDAALQQATVELATNGLIEPSWVYRPVDAPQWTNEARQAFEEDLEARMKRRNKKSVALEEGMEMRPFGVSPRDAQMYEIRRWAIERVSALYGVPLGMVGLDPNVSEARAEFYANTLPPYCEAFTRMLNQRVLARAYNWTAGCFEFNLDEKLMGDDRIKTLVSASGRAVMTTDEARAKLNLPPIDGGDELVTPLNVIVGEKPSPQIMPPQDPNRPPQDGSYRQEQGPTPVPSTTGGNGKALSEFEPLPRLHPSRSADLERQHRNIDLFQAVVQRHFNRLGRSLNEKMATLDAKAIAGETNWQRWDREFATDLNKTLRRVVDAEGTIYALKLGGGDFDVRRVENYLKAMAEGAAGAINDTIRTEIGADGLDAALGRAPQHVTSAGTSLGARSTMWAREEAARQSPGF